MGRSEREKGKRGEREWRDWLRLNLGCIFARRGWQSRSGGREDPDVKNGIPGTHAEVKRVEALNIWAALAQARGDAAHHGTLPYVAFRRSRGDWIVALPAQSLVQFSLAVVRQALEAGFLTSEDVLRP